MLSVIIPTRDKAPRLRLCLRTLAGSRNDPRAPPCEVIVVDDGSRDATPRVLAEALREWQGGLRSLRFDRPRGRAGARNAGADEAAGHRLLFLDDDVLVGPQALRRHVAHGDEDRKRPILARATILSLPWLRHVEDPAAPDPSLPPRLAARSLTIANGAGRLSQLRRYSRRSPFEADLHRLLTARPAAGRWPAATGGNLSIGREFFGELGGFDTHMGLRWGAEDLELGFRAEVRGGHLVHLDDVAVYHMDHPVTNREADHAVNLSYFAEKHGEVGHRLAAYFAGERGLEGVVTCTAATP